MNFNKSNKNDITMQVSDKHIFILKFKFEKFQ